MNLNDFLKSKYNDIVDRHLKKAENEFTEYIKDTESVIKYLSDKTTADFHQKPSRIAYQEYVSFCKTYKYTPVGKKKFSWLMIDYGYDMKSLKVNGQTMRCFLSPNKSVS